MYSVVDLHGIHCKIAVHFKSSSFISSSSNNEVRLHEEKRYISVEDTLRH